MREKLMELVYAARVHADEECDKQEGCSRCPYDAQADMCQNGPIVDHLIANGVVVREKGEWQYIGGDEWCCSVCGYVTSTEGRWEPMMDDFCRGCGSDMRKGRYEERGGNDGNV